MFCGFEGVKNTQFENKSNIGNNVNKKKNASEFISNKKVSTYDMLRPMYATTADKREKEIQDRIKQFENGEKDTTINRICNNAANGVMQAIEDADRKNRRASEERREREE